MNPFDVITAPPALAKRAFEDLHEIAQLARRYVATEDSILARVNRLDDDLRRTRAGVESMTAEIAGVLAAVAPLAAHLQQLEHQLDALADEMRPIQNLDAIRAGIEPLEHSMVAVRESVDELEPMIADLDRKVREIDPKLTELRDSVEPIGDLAERLPGNRRRRREDGDNG